MILFIDNCDSFTYNLVDYIGQFTGELQVYRNDELTTTDVQTMQPQGIVISPGPGTPADAGISNAVIESFHRTIPILGVCLGHQCIGQVFGARIVRAPEPVHGKASPVFHNSDALFHRIPSPFPAGRYHSLIIDADTLPPDFTITAWTEEGIIMGIQHREFPLTGVQFHPESVLTPDGKQLIANWLRGIGINAPETVPMPNREIIGANTVE